MSTIEANMLLTEKVKIFESTVQQVMSSFYSGTAVTSVLVISIDYPSWIKHVALAANSAFIQLGVILKPKIDSLISTYL